MEAMVQQSCDFAGTPRLNLEEWAAWVRSTCGGDLEVIDPNAFAGWMRQLSVYGIAAAAIKIQCGLAAVDHGGNACRLQRTRRAGTITARGRVVRLTRSATFGEAAVTNSQGEVCAQSVATFAVSYPEEP
jgi:hypothetical protein